MASLERLTKRVKKMEDWVKENESVGGPQGILDTFSFLVNEARGSMQMRVNLEQEFNKLRTFTFEFIQEHEMTEEWNEFLQEKENAVQEQSPEEIPPREEAEDSEEIREEDAEERETSEESEEKEVKD
jgi:hypothetical protein|tara:strand:- start:1415 stop:1798 length:384 start_codon:yes stop_codon:yes gene_type:complete